MKAIQPASKVMRPIIKIRKIEVEIVTDWDPKGTNIQVDYIVVYKMIVNGQPYYNLNREEIITDGSSTVVSLSLYDYTILPGETLTVEIPFGTKISQVQEMYDILSELYYTGSGTVVYNKTF